MCRQGYISRQRLQSKTGLHLLAGKSFVVARDYVFSQALHLQAGIALKAEIIFLDRDYIYRQGLHQCAETTFVCKNYISW